MSRSTTHTFTCPCGEVCNSTIYDYVNVAKEPPLRYIVLAGLLNVATCPNCGRKAAIAHPFIYSDPAYELLAYVHPRGDAPEEARLLILEKLRSAYTSVATIRERGPRPESGNLNVIITESEQGSDDGGRMISLGAEEAQEMPPLQVVFGLDQLQELINAVLPPEERLGKIALSTRSRREAERGQFHDIVRKLTTEMNCCFEVEDLPDEYTLWLFGSRRQIGALMRDLPAGGL